MRALRRSAVFISRKSLVGVLRPKLLTGSAHHPVGGGRRATGRTQGQWRLDRILAGTVS